MLLKAEVQDWHQGPRERLHHPFLSNLGLLGGENDLKLHTVFGKGSEMMLWKAVSKRGTIQAIRSYPG